MINDQAKAIPPSPHPIEAIQPDSTKIKLYLRGSPRQNWYEDENGYTVVRGPSRYVYALLGADGNFVSSGLLAGKVNPAEAGLKPGVRPSPAVIKKLRQNTPGNGEADTEAQPKIVTIPASPHVIEVEQPDGTKVKLRLRGDERLNWYEDLNGYAVMEEPGSFVYARQGPEGGLLPTKLVVGKADPAKAGLKRHIRPRLKTDSGDSPVPSVPRR